MVDSPAFKRSASDEHCRRHFILRTCVRAEFVTILCSQVENAERPWNCLIFLNARRSASWSASSESCGFRSNRLAALWSCGMQEAKSSPSSVSSMLTGRVGGL
jgi:hypothetical protein